ncbi:MAG: SoxR reducing system RseC family protein [Methylotenera sp.]|nr:SoxR reducing system RseC family protein [Methylotenera sp.]MDO9233436.1 SoxR reducing system RseC family protein [Methylotenera sp.]MDO9388307.1 SoxR reducing system RseC family protein [Methylotenera sp.]MDP2101645.1 SoxR reducing system RseC family protein [Methylotenera sp.]MDP2281493.1 SoxR reducing system RseC family protein [Methylotenera sp.]
MIEEYAIITECVDDFVLIEIERRTACGLCGQKRGCGNATWGKLLGHKSQTIRAKNEIGAKVGDSVVVGIDEHAFLSTVFYLYVVPLLSMLIAAVLADIAFDNEFYVILAAALGLVSGFLWVKGHLRGHGDAGYVYNPQYQAVVLRQAEDASSCENSSDVSCKNAKSVDTKK